MAIYSANYSRRLTRRLTLSDGTVLVTLRDAADLLTGERSDGAAFGRAAVSRAQPGPRSIRSPELSGCLVR